MAVDPYPLLLPELARSGAFAGDPLTLIDVGCSFGIDSFWRHFPLRARAIDPMESEIERLQGMESDPNVEYLSGFVKLPNATSTVDIGVAYRRSSANDASSYLPKAPEGAWQWRAESLSERELTLDQLAEGLGCVDFVKTDTDGGDLEVLKSGPETLKQALGVSVEALIGSGTRSKIDLLLQESGFTLFDEQTYRYSRAALPDRFAIAAPAQTNRGQVVWSQCLYLRDLVTAGEASDSAVRKMLGILELHCLNDCAAELVVARPEALAGLVEPSSALDLLAKRWLPEYESYAALRAAFERDVTSFYPSQ